MNTLDMYTREKANKAHLENMHQKGLSQRLLRGVRSDKNLGNAIMKQWRKLAVTFAALGILFAFFAIAFAMRF